MSLFDPFPTLETRRLRLRALTQDDTEDMLRHEMDEQITKFFGRLPITSIDEMRAKVDMIIGETSAGNAITWVLADIESGAFLGSACFWHWDKTSNRAELGYGLYPSAWGKGLMPEALAPILKLGFERMSLHSVEARVNPANKASIRVLEKLGFRKEGHLHESQYNTKTGLYNDTAMYSLLPAWGDEQAGRTTRPFPPAL